MVKVGERELNNQLRERYIATLTQYLTGCGEEVLRTNSNEIAIPCTDADNNDKYIIITLKIPRMGECEEDNYNGYIAADDYVKKCREKEEKREAAKKKKAEKIAKDKAAREAKRKKKEAENEGELV